MRIASGHGRANCRAVWAMRTGHVCHIMTGVRFLTTRRFTREFSKVRHESILVTHRGRTIGIWLPSAKNPKPMNFSQRVRQDFKARLPFTFADLLKDAKRR